jgi:hypothetical protein
MADEERLKLLAKCLVQTVKCLQMERSANVERYEFKIEQASVYSHPQSGVSPDGVIVG